jgi:hypothetical protein
MPTSACVATQTCQTLSRLSAIGLPRTPSFGLHVAIAIVELAGSATLNLTGLASGWKLFGSARGHESEFAGLVI